jgi:hypothetical protein
MLLHLLSLLTRQGYSCAFVDVGGCLDPVRANGMQIDLDYLLWVRLLRARAAKQLTSAKQLTPAKQLTSEQTNQELCLASPRIGFSSVYKIKNGADGQREAARCERSKYALLERAFKATDILIQNGGFTAIAVDLRGVGETQLNRVPLTTWFRFAQVAEKTQTIVMFLTSRTVAQSCTGLTLHIDEARPCWSGHEKILGSKTAVKPAFSASLKKLRPQEYHIMGACSRGGPEPMWITLPYIGTPISANISSSQRICSTVPSHAQVLERIDSVVEIARRKKPVQKTNVNAIPIPIWK